MAQLEPRFDEAEPVIGATDTTRLLGTTVAPDDDTGRWTGFDDFEGLPWWRKPSVLWLLGPFSLFTLAFGGTLVPKLNLVLDLVCRRYYAERSTILAVGGDNPLCRSPEVQKDVATFLLVINFVTGGLSAIVAPKLGHLSDRYGRRRLLALASCGGLVGELVTVLAAKFPETIDYRWLVLGAVFDGMTGSFTAGSILSQSYTSDCTPPSRRAVSIGYIQACLFMGLACGPLLSGYFVKWTGSLLSMFYVAIGCHAFFVLFVGLVMPESLSIKRQMAARIKWQRAKEVAAARGSSLLSMVKRSNPFAPLQMLWPTGWGTSTRLRLNLVTLAICDAIFLGAAFAVGPVLMLYGEFMFQWGNFETSRFISILSLTRVVVLMGILPLINYAIRVRPAARRHKQLGTAPVEKNAGADRLDIWILRVALFCEVVGCVGYTLSRDQELFVASGMMTALGGLGSATTQAAVTKHVPPERVGQMLGAIGMLHALSRIVFPVIFSGLYAGTVKSFPQAVFLALGGMFAFALVTTPVIKPHVHWHDVVEEQREPQRRAPQRLYSTIVETLPVDEDQFGSYDVTEQVFYTTCQSFALVNLKPLTAGHVLVCPRAPHRRLLDLSAGETSDLFGTVRLVQRVLARSYFGPDDQGRGEGGGFTVAVQDGPEAGQTVPHVHVHVMPRCRGGDDMGDDVYVKMAAEEGNVGGALWDRRVEAAGPRPRPGGGMPAIEDADRAVRSHGEMCEEAERYRAVLRDLRVLE
ncbi:hypothetical protein L249_4118 [Ophiocordyceps polyrhachis-furcata BCC 54312]|uniref:HIT domain-containing protein n=1 Tax=Ophiocordyceps polyrhachis-furcata BCC 54312 TaxID=1330021 RepID=A0A367L5M5_9HYPO|nr:hypothetical protein L249_4118 [Ophiocordyceps polyrhachis-furcata BCC 54312]